MILTPEREKEIRSYASTATLEKLVSAEQDEIVRIQEECDRLKQQQVGEAKGLESEIPPELARRLLNAGQALEQFQTSHRGSGRMKLIEKLALDHTNSTPVTYPPFRTELNLAFEAGFRKAREMASEIADAMELKEFGIQHGDYRKPFLAIGEEEV